MTSAELELVDAVTPEHFAVAGTLFREYAATLGVNLCFQDFAAELQCLPAMYGPPSGLLLLVMRESAAVGCGAVRRLTEDVCEMKRLYLRNSERGSGAGRQVAQRLIDQARALGYRAVRLDTLETMTAARSLYRSMGFREIAAYYDNPLPNTIYMELALAGVPG
jgi:putative acetyltransferase